MKPRKATEKKFTIPGTVKIDGVTFKVTEISKNAFKNNKKLTQVIIGKHVTKIGANAFNGAKKLKKITIKSTQLKKVGKKAFKGIDKKCKIKVPKKKLTSYETPVERKRPEGKREDHKVRNQEKQNGSKREDWCKGAGLFF
mgnify:CR=1 FL=1